VKIVNFRSNSSKKNTKICLNFIEFLWLHFSILFSDSFFEIFVYILTFRGKNQNLKLDSSNWSQKFKCREWSCSEVKNLESST